MPGLAAHIVALTRSMGESGSTDGSAESSVPGRPFAVPGSQNNSAAEQALQRLSGAVASSIFTDLISGALMGGNSGPPPASESAIKGLNRDVRAPAGAACPICLCELASAPEGSLTCMPCDHMFHEECLTQWLRSHNTCPVCRDAVEADDTPRPNSLAALLHGWRDARRRNEVMPSRGGGASRRPDGAGAAASSTESTPDAAMRPSEPELLRLSVAELKRRLTELNVDFAGVVEKRELQDLLRRHARRPERMHVQVHMEVVHVPNASSMRQQMQAVAARAAEAASGARQAGEAAEATAARAAAPAAASPAAASPAEDPDAPMSARRRRRREHVPGALREPPARRPRRS